MLWVDHSSTHGQGHHRLLSCILFVPQFPPVAKCPSLILSSNFDFSPNSYLFPHPWMHLQVKLGSTATCEAPITLQSCAVHCVNKSQPLSPALQHWHACLQARAPAPASAYRHEFAAMVPLLGETGTAGLAREGTVLSWVA